jgi:hypothetical protein
VFTQTELEKAAVAAAAPGTNTANPVSINAIIHDYGANSTKNHENAMSKKLIVCYNRQFVQNPKNNYYPDAGSLETAVHFDHVEGYFKDNKRNKDNWMHSEMLIYDIDDAVSIEHLQSLIADKLGDVEYYWAEIKTSRLSGNGLKAHVYFRFL